MNERDIFLSALEIDDPAARRVHLQTACGDDGELLLRVEALLASHEGQSQFLNTPAVEQMADGDAAGTDATILVENRSTDDEADLTAMNKGVNDSDDGIPLGCLQPWTKPASLGRLGHY